MERATLYKAINFFDELINRAVAIAMLPVLLVGMYFTADAGYVYYNARAARIAYHRPGEDGDDNAEKALAEDYAAWLHLDDTDVDYPVMQGEDNNKYLNTDPYGEYSLAGSIFLDSRNAHDFSDSYCVTYGHHMSGDYMFGALDRFYDKSYFNRHATGTLTVGDVEYPLQVFAMLVADASDQDVFQPGDNRNVLEKAEKESTNYRVPESGHILALTTCVDAEESSRTIVLCAMGEARKGVEKE